MAIRISLFLVITLFFFTNCNQQTKTAEQPIVEEKNPNLIEAFEKELSTFNNKEIASLDKATALFQSYIKKAYDFNQKDSLFMPYFNYYNIGRQLSLNEPAEIFSKYGFAKKLNNGKESLVPIRSNYLSTNVISHLSPVMQLFCDQQLKEFADPQQLTVIAENTIWWKNFNKNNPDFFLKEMTGYHYKNWHLRNLLMGTQEISIFTEDQIIKEDAKEVYIDFLAKNRNAESGRIISEYLAILEKNKGKKTSAVDAFLKNYE